MRSHTALTAEHGHDDYLTRSNTSGDASSTLSHSATGANDEEAAALVVRHLERLKGQWQGVLQDAVYER